LEGGKEESGGFCEVRLLARSVETEMLLCEPIDWQSAMLAATIMFRSEKSEVERHAKAAQSCHRPSGVWRIDMDPARRRNLRKQDLESGRRPGLGRQKDAAVGESFGGNRFVGIRERMP
jgi:hypothetical protein